MSDFGFIFEIMALRIDSNKRPGSYQSRRPQPGEKYKNRISRHEVLKKV
jgi:hypothetical protein